MVNDNSRKYARLLIFLCWLAYATAYIGRMNYSASMVAIIEQTGSTKKAAGLVASFFYLAYGVGQLVNGLLCHRYNSRAVVFGALLLSACVNVAMTFCPNVDIMKYLWLLNGCVQSVLWSTLIKLQAQYLSDKDISKSIVIMSTTVAAGTFGAYGLSALCVALVGWKTVFYVAGAILVVAAAVWFVGMGKVKTHLTEFKPAPEPSERCATPADAVEKAPERSPETADGQAAPVPESVPAYGKRLGKSIYIALAFVFLFALVNGFVRDGITTWTPNLLKETYGIETYFSIIITLVLPLISVLGAYLVRLVHKVLPNDVLLCGLFYLVGGGLIGLIMWVYTHNLAVTVIAFALVSCLMAAINNIVVSSVPFRLRAVGKSGMFAGVINTFCYIGSTVSSYLLGVLASDRGWNTVLAVLLALALAAGAVAAAFSLYWKKRISPLIHESRK